MRTLLKVFLILLLVGAVGKSAYCETTPEKVNGGIKHHGVVFNVADDRLIERIGGIYEPEGLDKYVQRRFDVIDKTLIDLGKSITEIKEELNEISLVLKKMDSQKF